MPAHNYYLPGRKLVNQDDAALVASPRVPRSKFINTWTRKTAFDAGYLIPFLVDDVLPGDHMTYDVTAYVRMATLLFPLFDSQRVDTHFFFVPNRLLNDEWEQMLGSQTDPDSSTDIEIAFMDYDADDAPVGEIIDHMGLPVAGQVGVAPAQVCVNPMPFRAYNLIWNEWFRDQNLQDSAPFTSANTADDPADYQLRRRAKFHDYFTSALPWPQKGTAQTVNIGGLAPIQGIGFTGTGAGLAPTAVNETARGNPTYANPQFFDTENQNTTPNGLLWFMEGAPTTGLPLIYADLSQATGMSINDFREAMLVQELLERDARGGTRYIEVIKNHFGVISQDARLQRPEYIGGGQSPLNVTPIAQTTPDGGGGLGALGAAGTAAGQHHASYAATEHGWIIGLISIRSEISYQQGVPRMWKRDSKLSFYWPTLAGLGEQAIVRGEIFTDGAQPYDDNDGEVWGYQERWQEYRTRQNEVTGIMRSTATGTLDAWHLAQEFSPAPSLNNTFIEDNPPMSRVLAAGGAADGQQYLADIQYRRVAVRPIPTFGIPASLTRF